MTVAAPEILMRTYGIHKPYVLLADLEAHLRLGWMPLCERGGAPILHPYHTVHLVWPCHCEMRLP